jgi:hypothetical protein
MVALEEANRVRLARVQLKRDIKAGRCDVLAILRDPPEYAEGMKVRDLLKAIQRVGDGKVSRLMGRLPLSMNATVGSLTEHSRGRLIQILHEDHTQVIKRQRVA